MGKINVLSFAVANLIAAGEAVDRPSSVIKELLENAIDSGATRVTVEIQNGGVTYMRVSDNGCGISRDDLPVAIRRHATSKIKDAEDLEGIITLGFRGEALAAIASVTDMRIISKTADEANGSILTASGGNILSLEDRACAQGTTVIVENLFANVPARRKFLKKDVTESMAVSSVVEKIALSKPHIAFKLIVDGNVKIDTVGDGELKNAIYSVFGKEFTSKLLPTSIESEGIKVSGFIGRPDNVRANRNYQNFFINGRFVKSKTACAALEQAYTSYIPGDKFPCCVLNLTVNPVAVDVNVHPAKLEVKFSNEKPVFEAIYYSVKNAIEQNTARPSVVLERAAKVGQNDVHSFVRAPKVSEATEPIVDERVGSLKKRQLESELYYKPQTNSINSEPRSSNTDRGGFLHISAREYAETYSGGGARTSISNPKRGAESVSTVQDNTEKAQAEKEITKKLPQTQTSVNIPTDQSQVSQNNNSSVKNEPIEQTFAANDKLASERPFAREEITPKSLKYRIVGEVFNSYVIVEVGEKMLIIDKHAAHERILFEQLKAGMNSDACAVQMLMLPIEVMMTSDEIETIVQYKEEITAVGFEFSAGKYTLNVTAIPEGIKTDAITDMLTVIADRLKSNTGSAKLTRDIIFEKALYVAACKAAIKAGREYADEHIKWIVDKLMEIPDITVCPHGRPVAMELSKTKLDHQFERT